MASLESISEALAARYAPGTISTPTGAEPMRAAYGQMPESLAGVPAVVIFPQSGEIVAEAGSWVVTHRIDAYFYLGKTGDLARAEEQRQKWLPNLIAAVLGQLTLGLVASGVKSAFPSGYEFVELAYGGDAYDGIIVHHDVIVREAQTFTP